MNILMTLGILILAAWIVALVCYVLFKLHYYFKVEKKIGKRKRYSSYLFGGLDEEKKRQMREYERQQVYKGLMLFISELKAKYPRADKELFDRIEAEFLESTSLEPFKEYEELVKQSHIQNINKNKVTKSKVYTLKDLDNVKPIERKEEIPILLELYEINDDFILKVVNTSTNECNLFQTQNYPLIRRYMDRILKDQQTLLLHKQKVKSISLEDFFNEKM